MLFYKAFNNWSYLKKYVFFINIFNSERYTKVISFIIKCFFFRENLEINTYNFELVNVEFCKA